MKRIYFFAIFLLYPALLLANDTYPLSQPQQQRFQNLLKNYRCLVCQNQDLADSNADLANDLKNEIYQQILQGKSNQQISTYLTSRYGDFVLFKPPLKKQTLILWLGPFALLLLACLGFFFMLHSKKRE